MSKKLPVDICHICGQLLPLSYEHIPPESAFNHIPRKMHSMNFLADENEGRYRQFQRGFGSNTICASCNSFTGSKYGKTYTAIVQAIGNALFQIPKEDRKLFVTVKLSDKDMLAFFKQVITMFCSVNKPECGVQFKNFLLNPESNNFDTEKYHVYMNIHGGPLDIVRGFSPFIHPETGNLSCCSEVTFFPVDYILVDISKGDIPLVHGVDITQHSQLKYGNIDDFELTMPVIESNGPNMKTGPVAE